MLDRLKASLAARYAVAIVSKLGAVPGALRGHLNVDELVRIAVTTLVAGGGSAAILPALLAHVSLLVPAEDVGVATALVTLVVEVVRRLQHGRTPLQVR